MKKIFKFILDVYRLAIRGGRIDLYLTNDNLKELKRGTIFTKGVAGLNIYLTYAKTPTYEANN